MNNRKIVLTAVVLVATVMVLSSMTFLFPGGTQSSPASGAKSTQSPASAQSTGLTQQASNTLQALQSKGIPSTDIYLPSFKSAQTVGTNISGPSYLSAPAPMGIGTYGFSNNSGVITRYTLNTSSFTGSVTFNNFSTFYPLDDGPNSVTVQLNSVLNNVTLFGKSNYSFWNQNVLFFSARTNTILFLDNIWNFSSPSFYMSPNVFSSYDGNLIAPVFYYAVGPGFTVTYPFTVQFYLNSTVMNGDNTVFFNYTLSDSNGAVSGSFDKVQFNSTYGMPAGYSAPQSNYLVTSSNVTPTGFIPYDSEIMIGGPGGGSTAMIYGINATMNLKYLNGANHYVNVPSAYDVGSETGETSTGIAETWSNNSVAHLSAGPSFVYGMWNVSQTSTFQHYKGQVNPPNSFMFVSQGGGFDAQNATWSPLSPGGSYSFSLPSGMYSTSILMSNRNPYTGMLTSGTSQHVNLQFNPTMGVYTPLYAFGNQQLQYISSSGMGTARSPYVLYNNPSPSGMLDPMFSTFNDYIFPEFSGVMLHGTTAYVVMYNMPTFEVQYSQASQLAGLQFFGVQYTQNQIGYVLYQTEHVTLTSSLISGWFANTLTEFPAANVLLWNAQNNLIAGNIFDTMDSSLLIYNMQTENGMNTVYGNQFLQDQGLNLTRYAGIAIDTTFGTSVYGPVAITVYSSHNVISRNTVIVYNPVNSPFYSIYSGLGARYINYWNGNFWWNYTPHTGTYDNFGLIAFGGDHHPVTFKNYNPSYLEPYVTNFLYN